MGRDLKLAEKFQKGRAEQRQEDSTAVEKVNE
jgi:hypothetical protein